MITRQEILNTEITGNLGPYINIGKTNLVPDISNNPGLFRIQYFGYFFNSVPAPIYSAVNLIMNSTIATSSLRNITKKHLLTTINTLNTKIQVHYIKSHLLNTIQVLNTRSIIHILKSHLLNTIQVISTSSLRHIVKRHVLNTIQSVDIKTQLHYIKSHIFNTILNLSTKGSVHWKNDWGNVGSVWIKTKEITYQVRSVIKRKINL